MVTVMYNLFTRHHIRPGDFWKLPRGEQLILMAFSDFEIEDQEKRIKEVGNKRG